ncbi:FAD/NAD(P)-binding oxidoreductase [Hymenobacter humi]|uniref:FAD/NAD(P)-binding oxidoreductase n=1 Tax=Hymenobacter humi TaxID=1411620 RepID=A0ABW2UC49_9BACT
MAILEPSAKHHYQPAWTLVGGGAYDIKDTERAEADYIPKGAKWLQDAAASFEPDANTVVTASGQRLSYDYLVVCTGIQLDWDKIKGAKEALGTNGVCSNYGYEPGPVYLGVREELQGRHGPVFGPQHAHQVRRGAAENHVPGQRLLA